MSRRLILAALVAALVPPAAGADDRDRKARAALALAAASAPEKCQCATGKLLPWPDALQKARAEGKPVVVFAGVEPRCCADAIPVRMPLAETSLKAERPIAVYAPLPDKVLVVATLPADATAADVKKAVKDAREKLGK